MNQKNYSEIKTTLKSQLHHSMTAFVAVAIVSLDD
jgi:hypothetical protein